MPLTDIDLSAFPKEREKGLRAISRYSLIEIAFYRPTLWQHVHRVSWIVEAMREPFESLGVDIEKARTLALVHDDAEMITGDYQAGHKAKMTPEQLKKLDEEEEAAAIKLAGTYPHTINGFEYEALLLHAVRKDCSEALAVMYADKFDAYCETLHEVLAGNTLFIWSLMLYERWFALYREKYPLLKPLAPHVSPLVLAGDNRYQPDYLRPEPYRLLGKLHTPDSLSVPTDWPFYNAWRSLTVEKAGDEGVRWLTEQKEFLPF